MKPVIHAALALVVFGCNATTNEIVLTGSKTDAGGTGSGADATVADDKGTGSTTGADTAVDTGPVTPKVDKVCDNPKATKPTGKGVAFDGLTYTPDTEKSKGITYDFKCTMCPGGKPNIDGKYKYFTSDDKGKPHLDQPDPATVKETLEFNGNAFVNIIEGDDHGTPSKVRAEGFYFCHEPGAMSQMKFGDYFDVIMVYTKVEASPAGAFGITQGAVDPCLLAMDATHGPAGVFLECNFLWEPNGGQQGQNEYCRIGGTMYNQQCPDPFATK